MMFAAADLGNPAVKSLQFGYVPHHRDRIKNGRGDEAQMDGVQQ